MLPQSGGFAGISMSHSKSISRQQEQLMAKTPAPTTKADKSKYTKASGPFMQRIYQLAIGSAAVISAFAFTPTPSSADTRSPAVIQRGHYCLSYSQGGFDCSFTSYAQCEATASGQNAECYGNTAADDRDPWNTRAQERPF